MFATVRSRIHATAVAVTVALATFTLASPPPATGAADSFTLTVTGTFANSPAEPFLTAGVASTTVNSYPFTFTTGCASLTGTQCPTGTRYLWDTPTGTILTGDSTATVTVAFPTVGLHAVTVTAHLPDTALAATATTTAAASLPLTEYPTQTWTPAAAHAWAAVASGALPPCATDPSTGGALWCPEPVTGPATVGVSITTNGIYVNETCADNPAACGTNPVLASVVQSAAPDGTCTTDECREDVITATLVTPEGAHAFFPGNCQDNTVLQPDLTLTRGAEPGCFTASDFAHAILTLTPTTTPPPAPGVVCVAGPQPTPAIREANALYPLLGDCDSDRAVTYQEAAEFLAFVSAPETPVVTPLAPYFSDTGTDTVPAFAELIPWGSAPGVSLRCPDVNETGNPDALCLNSRRAITRAEFAAMLYPLLAYGSSAPAELTLTLTPAPATVSAAQGAPVRVLVTAPVSTPVGTLLQLSSPNMLCPEPVLTLGPGHGASSVCFTPSGSVPKTTTVTAQVATLTTDTTASATTGIQVTAGATLTPSLLLPTGEKQPAVTFPAFGVSLGGNPVTLTVRSCDPASEVCLTTGDFPQTNQPRTTVFGPSTQTEVGTVTVGEVSKGRAELTLSPYPDPVTGEQYANGNWQFVLRACDSEQLCSQRLITNFRTPVPDPPVAAPATITTTAGTPTEFTLTGSDSDDIDRHPFTSSPVDTLTWVSIPTSLLQVGSPGSWSTVTTGTVYPLSSSFRWSPTAGETFTGTFTVTEAPTAWSPALTSAPAVVSFTATSD